MPDCCHITPLCHYYDSHAAAFFADAMRRHAHVVSLRHMILMLLPPLMMLLALLYDVAVACHAIIAAALMLFSPL